MERARENSRGRVAVILACLGTAAVFEGLTLLATHDKAARAASPWQDDPYDAVLSLAQFTVPMLAVVIAVRLIAWREPAGEDRAQQTLRAAGAMTALVALTLAFEWAAVVARAHAASWGARTSVLIGGLVATSVLTVVVSVLLVHRRRRRSSSQWRNDWLGDVVLVCQRVRVARRLATPNAAAWVRRRAMSVFVALSVLAAIGIIGALAIGERWTDPLLIAWALIVETTSNLAFCVIANTVAGFIARPPRTRPRRIAEAAVLAGCIAIQIATAFRAALRPVVGSGPLTSVPDLVAVTLGAGLIASLVTVVLLLTRTRCLSRRGPDVTAGRPYSDIR